MSFPKALKTKIIGVLRRIGYANITYKPAMQAANVERGKWRCAGCGGLFKRSELHGDHIDPVIDPNIGFVDWNTYMERLFLGEIQPLCKENCHKEKTRAENAIRKALREQDKDEEIEEDDKWEDIK